MITQSLDRGPESPIADDSNSCVGISFMSIGVMYYLWPGTEYSVAR